jgi:hypothetical protein
MPFWPGSFESEVLTRRRHPESAPAIRRPGTRHNAERPPHRSSRSECRRQGADGARGGQGRGPRPNHRGATDRRHHDPSRHRGRAQQERRSDPSRRRQVAAGAGLAGVKALSRMTGRSPDGTSARGRRRPLSSRISTCFGARGLGLSLLPASAPQSLHTAPSRLEGEASADAVPERTTFGCRLSCFGLLRRSNRRARIGDFRFKCANRLAEQGDRSRFALGKISLCFLRRQLVVTSRAAD